MANFKKFTNLFVGTDDYESETDYQTGFESKDDYSGLVNDNVNNDDFDSSMPAIVLTKPKDYDDVKPISMEIKRNKTVILNLEIVKNEDAKRILDFISGVCFATDSTMARTANKTYTIMPKGVNFKELESKSELDTSGYNF
ncbi:MAG: cell division protein SepF [Ruminococcus sp.]|nr:cell division protein SepF [Ruminococcus sp.]